MNNKGIYSKHGLCKNPLYKTWNGIKQRCYNPNNHTSYKNYGDRGITMCPEWLINPQNFIGWAEMQQNHDKEGYSIDRIDNDLGYSPENCRFTSRHIQGTNRRMQNNNTSGYEGIYYNKNYNTWKALLCKNKKYILQKHFPTKQEALEARNNFILDNRLKEYKLQAWRNE